MKKSLVTASLVALAAAGHEPALRPWRPAGPEDSRGPCPMLNTLANHGYLPHNGRNLTVQDFGDAVVEALNTAPGFGTTPAKMFIKGWGKDYFDLEDLNTPGILQHIASLSRDDVTDTTKKPVVVPGRVSSLLDDSPIDHINAQSIAKSRLRLEAASLPRKMSLRFQLIAYVESSLALMMMMDGPVPSAYRFPSSSSWTAPKDRVRVWLTEERLPDELGWKRSERQLVAADIFPVMKAIFDAKWAQSGTSWWTLLSSVVWAQRDEL